MNKSPRAKESKVRQTESICLKLDVVMKARSIVVRGGAEKDDKRLNEVERMA